ncbi:MAG: UDP-N-acetylmuramoyl-L-alanyl-D-glutamate--2,6-diaminopimelate ligase [Halioglobus sp.]|jgi:UDP-N-acetylmuramoyl-L-alanyl-D-glutamate--2,6-diaminopimelate ligase
MNAVSLQPREMPLAELLCMQGQLQSTVLVSGLQIDSRQVTPGDLFLAVPGENFDGRQFIEQAVNNGAVAVVAEPPVTGFVDSIAVPLLEWPELQHEVGELAARFYGDPSREIHVVGVTGTNGKTTTTWLIAQLVKLMGLSCGVIGTLGATLSDAVAEAINTTPDAVSLQRTFAQWREQGVFSAAMEVSSHALTQGRVVGTSFATAVFTNLSRDHLDYHGDMASYGRAKKQLFTAPGLAQAIVNLDDDYAQEIMSSMGANTRVISYSIMGNTSADVRIEEANFHADGVTAQLHTPWGDGRLSSPLCGAFNLSNLLAAFSSVALMTKDFAGLLGAVSELNSVPGRMQRVANEAGVQAIVDYAHTPDALEHVLLALRPQVSGRLITVFGCGGDRDAGKRPLMGRIASELSDICIVTSDNPRGEDPESIVREIASACTGTYSQIVNRAEAIASAVEMADAGDCVLVAGKGHEDYQIINGDRLHFSDEKQLKLAFERRAQS